MTTPGERFADAANELIKGIQEIQFIVHRPIRADTHAHGYADLEAQCGHVIAICERLIGPYKIIIADLTRPEEIEP